MEEIVRKLKPTCLIGAAAVGGVFTKQIIEDMSRFNAHPIIFALSNPTSKAECTAEQAYTYSKGKNILASYLVVMGRTLFYRTLDEFEHHFSNIE